jgi:hypothetical protein
MSSKTWTVVGAVLLVLAGCAPSNPGIEIEAILAPSDTCTLEANATAEAIVTPLLDTSSAFAGFRAGGIHYVAGFQLVNRMLNLSNSVYPLTTDTNSFHVEEAEVELLALDGSEVPQLAGLPSRFRVPAFGFIPSSTSSTEVGRGVAAVEVVPSIYGDALVDTDATILVSVRLTGVTSGDSTQTTADFVFPLRLCSGGCLFMCGMEADGSPLMADVLSCTPGQDSMSLVRCP